MVRSAAGGTAVRVRLAVLSAGFGSVAPEEIVAVLVNGPRLDGPMTWMPMLANPFAKEFANVQATIVVPLHELLTTFVCAETSVTPGGKTSVTVTTPERSGP